MNAPPLQPDRGQITSFVDALFRHADENTFVSLRAFHNSDRSKPPTLIRAIKINGEGLAPVIDAAVIATDHAANKLHPSTFAPPICTFRSSDRARAIDVANGLTISVEIDERPKESRKQLESILGTPTVVIESGSTWLDPISEKHQPKLHMHWRLSEPTRTTEEHDQLRDARAMACQLVGADPTGVPVSHPLRWAGSWNTKQTPKLARCVKLNPGAEIHLIEALDILRDAQEAAGFKASGIPASSEPTANPTLIASAMAAIPNTDVHYGDWVSLGYACYRSAGAEAFKIWDTWARTSPKYQAAETEAVWKRIAAACASPAPRRTAGAGTIFHLATLAGWTRPKSAAVTRSINPASGDLILSPGAPLGTARAFIARQHTQEAQRTIHHQNSSFFTWTGSHYVENAPEEMRARVYAFLDKAQRITEAGEIVAFDPTKAKVANAMEAVAAEAQLTLSIRPPVWLDDRVGHDAVDIMACANGLVHLPTRALLAHTPAFFTLNALDYSFDKGAPVPVQWLRFLATIWPDDPSAIDTLQEVFGLLLTGETRYQKAFLIVGPKRSGKGTIARILTAMLGAANCCGPTLSNLAQNFGVQPLIGKRLAIISDARLGGRADQQVIVERILSITGEDSLTVDRKNREAWTGQLGVRFVIMTNELPRLADASGALAGRFITLVMTQSFYGKEDLALTVKLLAELPSMLKWALAGLDRLRTRGYFVQPASSAQAQKEMEDLGSPIGAFLRDVCEVGQELGVRADHLYRQWCDWCRAQGRDHPGTVQTFGRDMGSAIPGLAITQPRGADGSRNRYYAGVALNQDALARNGTRSTASQSNFSQEPPADHWGHVQ